MFAAAFQYDDQFMKIMVMRQGPDLMMDHEADRQAVGLQKFISGEKMQSFHFYSFFNNLTQFGVIGIKIEVIDTKIKEF